MSDLTPDHDSSDSSHEISKLSTGVAFHTWRTQASPARAVVVLQHGFAEYAERYMNSHNNFIRHLINAGFVVYAMDAWGHGRSPGTRGVAHIGKAVKDHVELRELASKDELPIILFGHSLGGLITAGSTVANTQNVRGVILTGPALPDPVPGIARFALGTAAAAMPNVSVPGPTASVEGLTRDTAEQQRFREDPLITKRAIPFLLAATALDTMQTVNTNLEKWTVPTLILHGSEDTYTEWRGSEKLIAGIKSEDKTFQKYDQGRHELLLDSEKETVLKQIISWIEERI